MTTVVRNHTIDVLRGLTIILVVFGHITRTMWLNSYIWSFHIPVFFILSGFLYNPERFSSIKSFIIKKLKGLVVPYFFFGGITYLYWLLVESRFRGSDLNAWEQLFGLFYGTRYDHFLDFNGPLWFIPCLFTMSVFYFFIDRIRFGWIKWAITAGLFVFGVFSKDLCPWLPFGICAASIGLVFYASGNGLRGKGVLIQSTKNTVCKHKLFFMFLIILLFTVQVLLTPYSKANLARLETGNPFVYLGMAFLGILIFWLISVCIGESSVLEWLGLNSLVIFTLHGPVYRALIYALSFITKTEVAAIRENVLICVLITIITIILIIPLIKIWNKWGKPLIK